MERTPDGMETASMESAKRRRPWWQGRLFEEKTVVKHVKLT